MEMKFGIVPTATAQRDAQCTSIVVSESPSKPVASLSGRANVSYTQQQWRVLSTAAELVVMRRDRVGSIMSLSSKAPVLPLAVDRG